MAGGALKDDNDTVLSACLRLCRLSSTALSQYPTADASLHQARNVHVAVVPASNLRHIQHASSEVTCVGC